MPEQFQLEIESPATQEIGQQLVNLINSWFHRRPTTKWNERERRALRLVLKNGVEDQELLLLGRYYTDPRAKYKRTDVQTLLNNWNGELDRARGFYEQRSQTPTLVEREIDSCLRDARRMASL